MSDLSSWRDVQLDKLFNTTQATVINCDVEVKRVFNLLPYIWRAFERVPPDDLKNILMRHLTASDTWRGKNGKGCYKVKILWPREYHATLKMDNRVKNINVPMLHFGLFIHADESIKFSVTKPDLSDMELCRQVKDNDDTKIFDAIWNAAKDFPQGGTVEDRVNRVVIELSEQREAKQ